MSGTAGTGSRSGAEQPEARLRGARANGHLARVTALAATALIAAQWLAVQLPPSRAAAPEHPSRTAVEVTEAAGLALQVRGPERLAGVREQGKPV
ncbi:hypothetical protein WBG99_33135 [Streptomyces sp. TG1A-60]|uniref:hypothetical protein n=1 Tax=Streptomyces sp. TG1A-60 TaxID=3129111 RepID=UPI0030CBBAA2